MSRCAAGVVAGLVACLVLLRSTVWPSTLRIAPFQQSKKTLVLSSADVVPARVNELATKRNANTQHSVDTLSKRLVETLNASAAHHAGLDDSMFGKTGHLKTFASHISQASACLNPPTCRFPSFALVPATRTCSCYPQHHGLQAFSNADALTGFSAKLACSWSTADSRIGTRFGARAMSTKQRIHATLSVDIPDRLMLELRDMGIPELTAFQEVAITAVLRRNDTVIHGSTGSGKTLCFALPILANLVDLSTPFQSFVVVPTFPLAIQITRVFNILRPGSAAAVVRDADVLPVAPVVVGPPTELLRLLGSQNAPDAPTALSPALLKALRVVVLDEADEMLKPLYDSNAPKELTEQRANNQMKASALLDLLCKARGHEMQVIAATATMGRPFRHELFWVARGRQFEIVRESQIAQPVRVADAGGTIDHDNIDPPATTGTGVAQEEEDEETSQRSTVAKKRGPPGFSLPPGLSIGHVAYDNNRTETVIEALHDVIRTEGSKLALYFLYPEFSISDEIHLMRMYGRLQFDPVHLEDFVAQQKGLTSRDAWNGSESGRPQLIVASPLDARGLDLHGVDLVIVKGAPKFVDFIHLAGRTARMGARGRAIILMEWAHKDEERGVGGISRKLGWNIAKDYFERKKAEEEEDKRLKATEEWIRQQKLQAQRERAKKYGTQAMAVAQQIVKDIDGARGYGRGNARRARFYYSYYYTSYASGYDRGRGRDRGYERGVDKGYEHGQNSLGDRGYISGSERGAEQIYSRGRGRDNDRGADRNYDRGYDRSSNRGPDRGADRIYDRGGNRGFDKGGDRGYDRGSDRAYDSGYGRGLDRSYDKNTDRGHARSYDRGDNRGFDRGGERGYDRGSDRAYDSGYGRNVDRSYDKNTDRGDDRSYDRGDHLVYDRGNHPGYDRRGDRGADRSDDRGFGWGIDRSYDKSTDRGHDRSYGRGDNRGLDRDRDRLYGKGAAPSYDRGYSYQRRGLRS